MELSEIEHDKANKQLSLLADGHKAVVDYVIKDDKAYLLHSEVPSALRGKGVGKVLVERTFEKMHEEGYEMVAVCSYIKLIAQRSKQWKDIVG